MCDTNDHAVTVVLRQKKDKKPCVIYYTSKKLDEDQQIAQPLKTTLTMTKLHSKVIMYNDQFATHKLPEKKEENPRFIRWISLLHEFDLRQRIK